MMANVDHIYLAWQLLASSALAFVVIGIAGCSKYNTSPSNTPTEHTDSMYNGLHHDHSPNLDDKGYFLEYSSRFGALGIYDFAVFAAHAPAVPEKTDVPITSLAISVDSKFTPEHVNKTKAWFTNMRLIELKSVTFEKRELYTNDAIKLLWSYAKRTSTISRAGGWVNGDDVSDCLRQPNIRVATVSYAPNFKSIDSISTDVTVDMLVLKECQALSMKSLATLVTRNSIRHVEITDCGALDSKLLTAILRDNKGLESIEFSYESILNYDCFENLNNIHTVAFNSGSPTVEQVRIILRNPSVRRLGGVSLDVQEVIEKERSDILMQEETIVLLVEDIDLP